MKSVKKILTIFGKFLSLIFIALNLFIILSGNIYIYKAVWNTYLKGRSGPSIDEYKIFNNRIVKAGVAQEWAVVKDYNKAVIPDTLLKHFDEMHTVAFLVIKNDSIRYESYWDNHTDTSHTNSFSMAKTFVSILTGIAIDEGKIKNIDEPVSDFIPEFMEGENAKVKIRHLLTMSSGINFDEDYINPLAYPAKAYYGNDLKTLTLKYKVTEESGKTFRYLSGNTALLGFVIEKATGKTLSEYASEKLWKPLGASHNAFWGLDHENGEEKSYCCFNSNARDFARLGKLYLDSGRWNGKQIVPENYVLNSITPANLVLEDGRKNNKYGYSWWLIPDYRGHRVFYARGILGQYIFVIPDLKMIVVRLGHKRIREAGVDHPKDIAFYLDAALQMYP